MTETVYFNPQANSRLHVEKSSLQRLRTGLSDFCPESADCDQVDNLSAASGDKAAEYFDEPEPTDHFPGRHVELREQLESIYDLLTALDLIGDAIGGDKGHAISEVALQARSHADNVKCTVIAMGGR